VPIIFDDLRIFSSFSLFISKTSKENPFIEDLADNLIHHKKEDMDNTIVQAEFTFKGSNNDELCFKKGDLIVLTNRDDGGW
jgi:Variant SH3 domain